MSHNLVYLALHFTISKRTSNFYDVVLAIDSHNFTVYANSFLAT